jgi:AraC-like DNA-binding protein
MMLRAKPAGFLAQFAEVVWWSQNAEPGPGRERVLPTGAMTLVINLGDQPFRLFRDEDDQTGFCFRDSVVWGPTTRYAVRDTTRKGAAIGVHFRPGMAGAVLGISPPELTDNFASLEDLWGRRAQVLRNRLLEAATPSDKIAAVQRLLAPLHKPLFPHPAAAYALCELAKPPAPSVEQIRSRAGYGAKRFIELFRAAAGMTPKRYSRLLRFQNVLEQASRHGRKTDWARIAAEGGYTDQAHLIHEFKSFTGITPGTYKPLDPERPHHLAMTRFKK